jgi:hypothetical protein
MTPIKKRKTPITVKIHGNKFIRPVATVNIPIPPKINIPITQTTLDPQMEYTLKLLDVLQKRSDVKIEKKQGDTIVILQTILSLIDVRTWYGKFVLLIVLVIITLGVLKWIGIF